MKQVPKLDQITTSCKWKFSRKLWDWLNTDDTPGKALLGTSNLPAPSGVCNTAGYILVVAKLPVWLWFNYLFIWLCWGLVAALGILTFVEVALVVKNLPANAGDIRDLGSIPRTGWSPQGGHGNPLQYSCLENPRDRGAWWAAVHRVAKSQTQLKRLSTAGHGGFFSCSMWDLIPWPGMEPGSLHWELRILATGSPDKSWLPVFKATISWGVRDKNRSN